MPSHRHEAWIEMFRNRPSLAAELLADPLGVDLPTYQQHPHRHLVRQPDRARAAGLGAAPAGAGT